MDPITARIQTSQILHKNHVSKEAEKTEPESKNTDKVDIGSDKPKHGFLAGTLKGAAQVAGGVVGTFIGAAKGTIEGGASEKVKAPGENIVQTSRTAFAIAGVTAGIMSCAALGPAGLVLAPIVGGVVGSAVGGAVPGFIDGAWAGIKGAAKGGRRGMKTGIEKTGKAMDWMISKAGGSYAQIRNSKAE